jgi:probable HAF family extracellular repeat protein
MFELAPRGTEVSLANGINDDGKVAGTFSVGPEMALHACSRQNGKMTDLGTLAGQNTVAYAVNRAGRIVGGTNPANLEENGKQFGEADQPQHAFCCFNGEITDLNDLIDPASGWVLADARSVSAGKYVTGTGLHKGQAHAYLLKLPPAL